MLSSLSLFRILRAAASEPGRMHGLPSLTQNQLNEDLTVGVDEVALTPGPVASKQMRAAMVTGVAALL